MTNNEAWLDIHRRRGYIVVSSHKPERLKSVIFRPITSSGNEMSVQLKITHRTTLEDAVDQAKLFRELTSKKPIAHDIIQIFDHDKPFHYQSVIVSQYNALTEKNPPKEKNNESNAVAQDQGTHS